jgi:hypothetical protein
MAFRLTEKAFLQKHLSSFQDFPIEVLEPLEQPFVLLAGFLPWNFSQKKNFNKKASILIIKD